MTEDRKILLREYSNSFYTYSRLIDYQALAPKSAQSIPKSQLELLYLLLGNSAMSTQEIASSLNISSSAVSQLVDSLTVAGLAQRSTSQNDRRRVSVKLTGDGVREAMSCQEALLQRLDKFFTSISDDALVEAIQMQHNVIYKHQDNISKQSGK